MNETEPKMPAVELVKRYALLVVGLFIMTFGIAFSIKGDLGTSPISSFPYVTSLMSGLTVGNMTIVLHCILIALQILILRKDYQLIQLIQLPVAVCFGYMTDFALWVLSAVAPSNYLEQWLCCLVGILLVGIGVSCEVTANVVCLAGEGFVLAVVKKAHVPFGKMKVGFDVSLVVISVVLSLLFLHSVEGVREGTLAAMILVGITANIINTPMKQLERRFIKTKKKKESR